MKVKKIPLRTCVITREKLPKQELLRVVRDKEGNVSIDLSGKAAGKGAYLKKEKDVIIKAKQNKRLDNVLEVSIPDEIYEELIKLI